MNEKALPPAGTFDPSHALPAAGSGNDLQDEVERRVRQVETHVRARPFMTVAAALFAGFLVGRILR